MSKEIDAMKQIARAVRSRAVHRVIAICFFMTFLPRPGWTQPSPLCLDGFCIGQTITNARFDSVAWITPKKDLVKETCSGVGCQPENAFRGYASEEQVKLAGTLSWKYGSNAYNIVTKDNLGILRQYKYECNPSARGIWGERRFLGVYRSIPRQYLTVVGLRLINGELTVYRIARQYPYHDQNEIRTLAKELSAQYGKRLLLYDYLSSNAYSQVIEGRLDGWFARSTLFNPTDLSDNAAELVLIDPTTRTLLQPSSMPDSGEIKPLPVTLSRSCSRSLPLQ